MQATSNIRTDSSNNTEKKIIYEDKIKLQREAKVVVNMDLQKVKTKVKRAEMLHNCKHVPKKQKNTNRN
jgi:hypothetical protein